MNPAQGFTLQESIILLILNFWSLFWKGLALWKASKNNQRNWFVVLLIVQTIGILEIIYLFRFAKVRMKLSEIKEGFKNAFFTKPKSN